MDIEPAMLDMIADSINGYMERLDPTDRNSMAFLVNDASKEQVENLANDAKDNETKTFARVASFLKEMQI